MRRWYFPDIPCSRWESPSGHCRKIIGSPRRYTSPLTEESNSGHHWNTTRPLILFSAQWSVSPTAPAFHCAIILQNVVPRKHPHATPGTHGVGSV